MVPAANAETIVLPETSCALNKAEAGNARKSVFLRRIQTAPTLALALLCKIAFSVPCSNRAKGVEVFLLMLTPSRSLRLVCTNNSLTSLS